ncbi:MAG: glycosyltransferase family 4 protein, partial [Rhizomicrobium sp.]
MRILYHHRIGSKDGQAVHLEELVAALRKAGHEVRLVGPESFARASFGHEPALIDALKRFVPKFIYELMELGYNIPAFFRLLQAGRRFNPDIVYERYNLYLLAGIWFKRLRSVPLILEVNAPLVRERASFGGLGLAFLAVILERWVWRNADFVLPVTGVLADEIRAAGTPAERIMIIPNAIDPANFPSDDDGGAVRKTLGLQEQVVLGFTGFVRDWHGLDRVLKLLARDDIPRDLHFLIVGDGPAIPKLTIEARELGVANRITFAGLVGRDRLAGHVAAFDIGLLPDCVAYCSPLKLFEYMAAGKAIVAPDQPNIREVLEDRVSCLLFPPDNSEAMVDAILALAGDKALRDRLGGAARALVSSRGYTWRHNADRVGAMAAKAALRT